MNLKIPVLTLLLALAAQWAASQEAVVTLRSTVTGNQEQPRVMYILPWQQPGAMQFEYTPGSGLAQDLFTRIDREEFLREMNYREMLSAPGGDLTNNTHHK